MVTPVAIHTVSYIPRDSSVLLSSFFTRSMAFTHILKVQLSFALFSETFFNDTAEFTLCYGLHNCSPLLSRLLYPLA